MTKTHGPPGDAASESAADPVSAEPDALSHAEVLARSEMARFIRPSELPARASAILAAARDENAPAHVLSQLERLPHDVEFPNVAAIRDALGHETEHRKES